MEEKKKKWDVEEEVTNERLETIFQRFINDSHYPSKLEIEDYHDEEELDKKYMIRYKY